MKLSEVGILWLIWLASVAVTWITYFYYHLKTKEKV